MDSNTHTYRSVRYRLLPGSRGKHDSSMRLTGACIHVWNKFLERHNREFGWHRQAPWVVDAPGTSFFSLGKLFTEYRGKTQWLGELPFAPVRYVLKHQAEAWKRYFASPEAGRPKFKSGFDERNRSVTFPESKMFKRRGGFVYLQRLGWFGISRRGGDPYEGQEARSLTVKRECGRWYAVVLYKVPVSEVQHINDGCVIGVDMNVGQVADSEGEIHGMPDLARLEAGRRRYQRRLARQVKGSNRRERTKLRLGKTSRNIRNVRDSWQHQVSKSIVGKASIVGVERLNTKGMAASAKGTQESPGKNVAQKAGLNRGILDTGWHELKWKLGYKSHMLVEVPAQYTSQACNGCGFVSADNRKTQSGFACLACGHENNADVNAAANIRDGAIEVLSETALGTGAAGRGGGGVARPVKRQDIARMAA